MCSTVYLLLFVQVTGILSQSCDYIKNIPVKYRRYSRTYEGTVFLSECINDQSMRTQRIKYILIECQTSKLPELKANFISDMAALQSMTITKCNVSRIHPGAFINLPNLKSIIMTKNNLSHIPGGIVDRLPKLNYIYLRSNNITTIENEAFANLPALENIYLDNNNIKHIFRNWFTNTTNIKDFSISSNQIEEVPPMMFKGWTKAILFDLSQNFISVIHKEAFANVSRKILMIDLHSNYLKGVDADSFPLNSLILVLKLDFNLLNYIPENFLRSINCRSIAILGNPFKCPCLTRTYEVTTETSTSVNCDGFCNPKCNLATLPICGSPSTTPEYCVESLDQEVTDRITSYVKEKLGYSSLHHWAAHCKSLISPSKT